ncbi:MAG: hypothetical protein B7Z68_09095 [Acidobacteria bacterium 21-70-11]|nr:MAG: hypothetical protein B7Z68_09095 [Acidobacteria bacterium 21-70-11]
MRPKGANGSSSRRPWCAGRWASPDARRYLSTGPPTRIVTGTRAGERCRSSCHPPTVTLSSHLGGPSVDAILTEAVQRGSLQEVQGLLKGGIDLRDRDDEGGTLLMIAAAAGQLSIVKLLVEAGAEIDARNNAGMSPLLLATAMRQQEIVKFLAQRGANINGADEEGHTALMIAARTGSAPIVECLLAGGANPNAANRWGTPTRRRKGRRRRSSSASSRARRPAESIPPPPATPPSPGGASGSADRPRPQQSGTGPPWSGAAGSPLGGCASVVEVGGCDRDRCGRHEAAHSQFVHQTAAVVRRVGEHDSAGAVHAQEQ